MNLKLNLGIEIRERKQEIRIKKEERASPTGMLGPFYFSNRPSISYTIARPISNHSRVPSPATSHGVTPSQPCFPPLLCHRQVGPVGRVINERLNDLLLWRVGLRVPGSSFPEAWPCPLLRPQFLSALGIFGIYLRSSRVG
jgi:hypothetical protein